jgi:hypothetical protein
MAEAEKDHQTPSPGSERKLDDVEKTAVDAEHNNHASQLELAAKERAEAFIVPTPDEEKAVIRKLDWRLMPIVFFLYMLAVLDRSNLGNAKLAGMEDGTLFNCLLNVAIGSLMKYSHRSWRLELQLARNELLHRLHLLSMASHGLEAVPSVSRPLNM